MRNIRKIAVLFLLLLGITGCASGENPEKDERLSIVAAIFPAYDFARQISGEDAIVTLLVRPGAESHSYEPSPQDLISIENCDLFIYPGGESDIWITEMLESMPQKGFQTLSMMDCVETLEEEWVQGMQGGPEEEAELDEHVWTDPMNAAKIAESIAEVLAKLDPDRREGYRDRAEVYRQKMKELDEDFRETVENGERKVLLFADRFPMRYFTRAYQLTYYAAFPGCSHETEPSAETMIFLIDQAISEQIGVVLQMELSDGRTADTVCEASGAVKRTFYSGHTVTKEELEAGITYEDLMRRNLEVLKEALN